MGPSPGCTASRTTMDLAVPLLSLQPGEICLSLLQKIGLWWKSKAVSARMLFGLVSNLQAPAGFFCDDLQALRLHSALASLITVRVKFGEFRGYSVASLQTETYNLWSYRLIKK